MLPLRMTAKRWRSSQRPPSHFAIYQPGGIKGEKIELAKALLQTGRDASFECWAYPYAPGQLFTAKGLQILIAWEGLEIAEREVEPYSLAVLLDGAKVLYTLRLCPSC